MSPRNSKHVPGTFENAYPSISTWLKDCGWIEIGQDGFSRSFARALDEGGMVWEGKTRYATIDAALDDLETGLKQWMKENL